jgi:hypothetical protein
METPRNHEFERDDIGAAVLRERELNEALSYLDRAISQFANQEVPSRWLSSHSGPHRQAFPTGQLALFVHRCVAAFRTQRNARDRFTAIPSRPVEANRAVFTAR